ncbi:hypothetical protein K439DRAFT_1629747 [Ramaria rubella]|nr:hypothetical protein K439DRAFT_1629747 [Ramaria rubella]
MWCTRWFLPLLLLPLPIASPYFLFLFFFSLTLHARPCFYCIILLTALFTSSCYWQPVPTRALFEAAFPNASSSSPLLYLPNSTASDDDALQMSQLLPVPKLTQLLDRCWCDLSSGHLFDPYNITQWQMTSLSRSLGDTKSQRVLIAQENQVLSKEGKSEDVGAGIVKVWVLSLAGKSGSSSEEKGAQPRPANETLGGWLRPTFSFLSPFTSILSVPFNFGQSLFPNSSEGINMTAATLSSEKNRTVTKEALLPFLRRTYDLRPYGMDLVLDLGWGRSHR